MTLSAIRVATGQGLRVPPLVGIGFTIYDEKATTVEAGSSVASPPLNIRQLNTEMVNNITGASLGTNQFTLPAGTFDIIARVQGLNVGRQRLVLHSTTRESSGIELEDGSGVLLLEDASTLLQETYLVIGTSDFCNEPSGGVTGGTAHLRGRFTLIGTEVLELHHFTELLEATIGLGAATDDGTDEVYALIQILEI